MKGLFFTFEGIDGSGKSTQMKILAERLREEGYQVLETEEPSPGYIGDFTRQTLKNDHPINEASSALLFAADRLDHLHKKGGILELLEDEVIILCDRYLLSALTYNSLSNPLEWVLDINRPAMEALRPTAHLLFDLPAQAAMERIEKRGEMKERYENLQLLHKVRMLYQQLSNTLLNETIISFQADQDEDTLSEEVWQAIQFFLPKKS